MFYESERILNKNLKYEKTRAYAIISSLETKGLSNEEMIEAVNILICDSDNSESQLAILEKAKVILNARQKVKDDENIKNNDTDSNNLTLCPIFNCSKEQIHNNSTHK